MADSTPVSRRETPISRRETPISRRAFLKGAVAGAACLGLSGLSALAESERPPNVVVILADDLGYQDVGCFGSPLIKTPRLDRMAAQGMRFTDFYAAPVCTPARASFMTGCYPRRVGLPSVINYNSAVGISSDEITIAQLMKSRGYATCCIGKWHLGWQKPFLPTHHGFDYYYGLPYSNDMLYGKERVPLFRNEDIIEQPANLDTLTERYTDEAVRFINEHRDQPFFLYLPHTYPHVPLHASERFSHKSKRGIYGDVVECIDWSAGRIFDTLKKLGLDDNTLVVFTSDNGPWLQKGPEFGGCALPLRAGKGTTWEGGMREPTIMRWPGHIPAGSTCSEVASIMDLLPTISRLAGTHAPTDRMIDGRDIRPLMMGTPGAKSPHDEFFYYWNNELQAVRSGKWKLILPHQDRALNQAISLSLYDLQADVSETTDVLAKHPDVVKRLLRAAERMREDVGDDITRAPGKNCRAPGKV